jgi:ABC-type multidrug transport system fused ATPase/permease subunit
LKILQTYKRLWPYARPFRGRLLLASLLNVVSNQLNVLFLPVILPIVSILLGEAKTIDLRIKNEYVDTQSVLDWFTGLFIAPTYTESLVRICGFILGVYLLKNLFGYVNGYVMAVVEGKMVKSIRDEIFTKLSGLSLDYYYERKAGQLLSRVTNDVSGVNSSIIGSINTLIGQPLQIITLLWILFAINAKLAFISFGIAALSMWVVGSLGKSIKSLSHRVHANMGDLLAVAQEMISGVKVVKSFGMESYEVERFKRETESHYRAGRRLARIRGTIGPINEIMAVSGFIGILWFGGQAVHAGEMRGGELLLFLVSLVQVMQPIRVLSELSGRMHEGAAQAENLFTILDANPTVVDGIRSIERVHKSALTFESVSYKYKNAEDEALKGIDLEIFPNEVIALVGPSGAGKTTLVDLVARFYDPSAGSISLNGHDLREYRIDELRKLYGIVTQDTVLFHDTIFNNIAYGNRNASYEQVVEAAKAANAHDFISSMPEAYETIVGDRGVRMSGGQRQRIAIARALLKNPPILIFDEATSALDTESEMLVQEAIQRLLTERTAIVIAHRLSTIQQADRIVVMNEGRIVEIGTHDSLLANSDGLYHKLYSIQLRAASEGVVNI